MSRLQSTLFTLIASTAILLWAATGMVICGGSLYFFSMLPINLILATLFLLISWYQFLKFANSKMVLQQEIEQPVRRRFFLLELLFFALSTAFGGILLSGAISRVFFEKAAVFG